MPQRRSEIGAVGLPIFAGYLALDPNNHLRGRQGVKLLREMRLDEPAAAALWYACGSLLRTDLQVEAGGTTDADKAAAEYLESTLLDMRAGHDTYLRQMYSMIWAGWDVHEQVFKRRSGGGSRYNDGLVGWAHWGLRRQESLERWQTDPTTGETLGIIQRPAPTYTMRTIPLRKCIHFVADDSEGSPEGQSAFRGMYRQWYFVKNLELLWGIALERFGTGIPVFEGTADAPASLTAQDEERIREALAAIRQNEEAGLWTPKGYKFYFAPSPGLAAEDYLKTISYMRAVMLSTALADFIALGTGTTGSWALGRDKSELFLLALNGYQERLTGALNRQAVALLFRYNQERFRGITDLPRFTLPAVKRYDLQQLGSFTKLLHDIGAFTPGPADEAFFRRIADLVNVSAEDLEARLAEQAAVPVVDETASSQSDTIDDVPVADPEAPVDETPVDEEAIPA